ncbi:MAG: glycosyltransferase family 4 protein [Proteobacteria bacterium]|nr:glycosyltransferase family 4 protein [Pseudomonadota bacterium]
MTFNSFMGFWPEFANKLFTGISQEGTDFFPGDRIALNQAVSGLCLRNASLCIERQAMEEALQWDVLAARIMAFDCAVLTSPELENQLLQIGTFIKTPVTKQTISKIPPTRWLHVLTEVYPDGGHGNTVKRWIQLDHQENTHSVVLLAQTKPVPESLTDAVRTKGGAVIQMDPQGSLVARATSLRELVWTQSDVVVLHIHPWDVIATVALGVTGGPPVLLLNHAAHIFWVGASIADVIIDIRNSAEEDEWTIKYRGIDRIRHLPIPLSETPRSDNAPSIRSDARSFARKVLRVPEEAVVLLTVGHDYKYKPVQGLDFLKTIETILSAHPDVYLLAAGPSESKRWKAAREATGGRVLAFGIQRDLEVFHAAADVYLEGFPFGSTTSLLESGLKGIPCVLPPKICPPPFVTDGVSVECLEQSSDMTDYIKRILTLLVDKKERQHQGKLLSESIINHHCGKGWLRYLEELQNNLPCTHQVYPLSAPCPVPEYFADYWSEFSSVINEDPFDLIVNQSIALSLKPVIDEDFLKSVFSKKVKVAHNKASKLLVKLGDYNYLMHDYPLALKYYRYAVRYNPFLMSTLLKGILLRMGHIGIKVRNDIRKVKNHFGVIHSYIP